MTGAAASRELSSLKVLGRCFNSLLHLLACFLAYITISIHLLSRFDQWNCPRLCILNLDVDETQGVSSWSRVKANPT